MNLRYTVLQSENTDLTTCVRKLSENVQTTCRRAEWQLQGGISITFDPTGNTYIAVQALIKTEER